MKQRKYAFLWIGFAAIALMIIGGVGYSVLTEPNETLTQTARDYLTALKKGNYSKAYYLYTSDNYQEQNSLEQFRKWVGTHPILRENTVAEFYGEYIKGDFGTLSGELRNGRGSSVPIIYKMISEYGDWKIDRVQTVDEQTALSLEQPGRKNPQIQENEYIAKVIQDHLKDLKNKKTSRAYNEYFAEEFKKSVSYEEFESIVKENPELAEFDSIRFEEIKEDENLKRVDISLISDIDIQDVQFWLAKDRGQWKIWAIEVGGSAASDHYEVGENTEELNGTKRPNAVEDKDGEAVQAVKSQLQAIKKGEVDKAYKDYVSQEFRDNTSVEEFEKFINNYPELTEFQSITIKEINETEGLVQIYLLLTNEKGDSKVDYWLAKQNGDWKVLGIRILESAYYPPISDEEKEELIKIIENQLEALREGDAAKAYHAFTSKDFQNNTSFEDFNAFLADYPILTEHTETTPSHGIQVEELRQIKIVLQSENQTVEVAYRLIKEDGEWKVWGIRLLTSVPEIQEDENEIKDTIKSQIEAMKSNDLSKAYYALTSKQFREAASFEAFKEYVSRHNEMRENETALVADIQFKPTYASATVNLEGPSRKVHSYLYRLTDENNNWKILSIKSLSSSDDSNDRPPLRIGTIKLGTETDLNGLVADPKQVFASQDREITANVHIENGKAGDQIEAVLEHVNSNSSIPPVATDLDTAGSSVVIFAFTAPTKGWPAGLYRLYISTSPSKADETVEFTVKKDENNSRKPQESEDRDSEGTKDQAHPVEDSGSGF